MIRQATLSDLDCLIFLEHSCFNSDRLSHRQLRYMLTQANGQILVAEQSGAILGYGLLLFKKNSSISRLYSIAVASTARRKRIGEALVRESEIFAQTRGSTALRLEIRVDNHASLRLFHQLGYKKIKELRGYYEDGTDGVRLEKQFK
ncbi:GNAT family N-acetyltransferase [Candidatus Nitrosacidococcus tergens]|uniref:GCN5-related N-acetyltransferase n=1 Tax=Candidatus Nitrosacidococcus tergens TaxID=553981 RepID=A0A7G1QBM1_9GAMM